MAALPRRRESWSRCSSRGAASHLGVWGANRRCGRYRNRVRTASNRNLDQYQFTVRPLSKEEGGGYLVEYPDIPGCMSDGETVEEAITNGREALHDCLEVFKESGRKVPRPSIEASRRRSEQSRRVKKSRWDGSLSRFPWRHAGASSNPAWSFGIWLPSLDTFRTFAGQPVL